MEITEWWQYGLVAIAAVLIFKAIGKSMKVDDQKPVVEKDLKEKVQEFSDDLVRDYPHLDALLHWSCLSTKINNYLYEKRYGIVDKEKEVLRIDILRDCNYISQNEDTHILAKNLFQDRQFLKSGGDSTLSEDEKKAVLEGKKRESVENQVQYIFEKIDDWMPDKPKT